MLMFGVYLLIGIVTMYVEAFMHLYLAERNGYEAIKFWSENGPVILGSVDNLPGQYILGVIIWPVRAIEFALATPQYYELYELKDSED